MTIQEMHKLFDLKLEAIASEVLLDIHPTEKDLYLNDAIIKIVKEKFSGFVDNNTALEESLVGNSELFTLLKTSNQVVYTNPLIRKLAHVKVSVTDLPEDCLFPVSFYTDYEVISTTYITYPLTKDLYKVDNVTADQVSVVLSGLNLGFSPAQTLKVVRKPNNSNTLSSVDLVVASSTEDEEEETTTVSFSSNIGVNGTIWIPYPTQLVDFPKEWTSKQLLELEINSTLARLFKQEEVFSIIKDPFNSPKEKTPIVVMMAGKLFLYHAFTTNLHKLNIMYVKVPAKVSNTSNPKVNCDLPIFLHDTVLDTAVKMAYIDRETNPNPAKIQTLNQNL